MIDHMSLPVRDLARAGEFYDMVLATLGLYRQSDSEDAIGYGPGEPYPPVFWLLPKAAARAATPGIGLHVGFRARDRTQVHDFHAVAMVHGAVDAGWPGPRPEYSAGYYGCFVIDLDGFKIEAVTREALQQ